MLVSCDSITTYAMILLLTDKSADFDSLLYDFKTLCMRYDILDYHTLLMFGVTYTIVYA